MTDISSNGDVDFFCPSFCNRDGGKDVVHDGSRKLGKKLMKVMMVI